MRISGTWMDILTVCAALGCGLIAGAFFAFSSFVMPALARVPAPTGIAAMQAINVRAVTPLFMTALFGTAGACLVLVISALLSWQAPGAGCLLAGGALYLVGAILVTIFFNVPLNDALAATNPSSADGAQLWAGYVGSWTAWNHVRTVMSLIAAFLLTLAFCLRHADAML